MKKKSFTRFRIWLALLIGVLLSSYLTSTGISIWRDYELTIERAKRIAQSLVSALDEHADRTFGEADQALLNVIGAINNKGGIDAFNERTLHELFLSNKQQAPQIGEFILVNSRGMLLASSSRYPIGDLNVSEKEYFIHFRDHPTSDPFISRPLQTAPSKLWRVILARGIRDSNGKFQGVIAIELVSDYFNKFYKSIDVGEGGFVDLVRRDGYSLIHEPFSEIYATVDFSKHPLFTEHLPKAPFGTYFSQSPITFKTYLRSYRIVTGFPLVAVISLPKDDILKRWHSRVWNQGASAIMLLAIVSILSILLFMHLRKLEIAEEIETRLIAIIESSNDAIIGKTLDGEVTSWNQGAEKIYGYSAQEILGKSISCMVPNDRQNELPEIYQKIRHGIKIEPYESVRRRKDGQEIHVSLTISPIKDIAGKIIGISTISRDITERKLAEMERDKLIGELQEALAQVKTLKGLLPICAHCKRIRDDQGYWNTLEKYFHDHSEVEFSHSICPNCLKKHYPAFLKEEAPVEKKIITAIVRGQGRILVMDDEESVRHVVSKMLERLGYEVACAKDGTEAIDLYKRAKDANQPFAAAIFDMTVPGRMGGKEALEQLLVDDPKIKVIASSGYPDDLTKTDFARHGFIGAITKPYRISELSKVLDQVIMKSDPPPES